MPFKFYIQDLYDRTEVIEPRGWKGIVSILERDFSVHGVFFKYTDGSVKLGFSCDSKTLLEAAYQADGAEAFYLFEVDEADNALTTFTTIFSGEMDFSKRKFDEDFFEIDVNEINEIDKIKNRADLKMSLNKGLTLDGIDVSNINFDGSTKSLATKVFSQLILKRSALILDSIQSTAASASSFLFGIFGFDTVESTEIKKYKSKRTRITTTVINGDFLVTDKKAALSMNFDFDFAIDLTEDQGSGTTTYQATLKVKFEPPVLSDLQDSFDSFTLASDTGAGASPFDDTLTLSANVTEEAQALEGTRMWFELEIEQTSTGTTQMSGVLDITKFYVTITDKIAEFGTVNQWYHSFDSINKILTLITGEYDYLFSDLLGDLERGYSLDGCLSQMRLVNGFRVRQINDNDKAPIESFKDYIKNLNVIGAIGYGIEKLETPLELGIFTIATHAITIYDTLTIDVSGDISSFFDIGSKIGFFDNEFLYGSWPVTSISYDGGPDETEVIFDVTGNQELWQLGVVSGITVFITSDKNKTFKNKLRLEKWEHFYGDNELIDLGVVQGYSEEPFDDILYNELEIGFNKFANDEDVPGSLEEFHTQSGWTLPIVKSKGKLSLMMSWIGSTILFNESRAQISSDKPTTSHKLDNDIFFCEKVERKGTFTVDFSNTRVSIFFPATVYENIIEGATLWTVSGATDSGNNTQYEVDPSEDVFYFVEKDTYEVPVVSFATNRTNDEVFIQTDWEDHRIYKPRADDGNLSTSGLTRPFYTMNQLRTIKRFLIRWGRYINSILAYLVDSANVTIQNLFYINNGDFSTELDTSQLTDDCLMDDNSGALLREADNVNSLALGTAKFKPNLISGTVKICDEDFDRIKDAHKNTAPNFAVLDGTIFGTSSIAKSDTNFVHQTGIFDIVLVARFDNFADTVEFNYLAATYVIGDDGFAITFTNSLSGFIGALTITIRVSASTSFAYTENISSILVDGKKHTIRYIGKGSTVEILVDGILMDMVADSISPGGSADSNQNLEIGGVSGTPTDMHEGLLESFKLKNGSNEEIINYQFNERQGLNIANEGNNAPASSGLTLNSLPTYENRNYGYITMTSPNAKTVSGWLMKIKRNPVDRIAKIEILEKHGASESARLLESGDFRLLETGDFRLLE
ncbi:MAG: hypothetical protein IIC75_00415 [Bacteroidetes bacterium]|nr:hypothetical protein [Bacteroidota bacterium]